MNSELRCSRRKHAVVEDNIVEVHCRYHSYKTEATETRVFHRWKITPTGPSKLDDRTETTPRKDAD